MASLTYDGVDFATTLGALPRFSRDITPEIDPGTRKLVQERHTITLEWTAVPAAGSTLAQSQTAVTNFEAAVEALANDGALIFKDNAGNVAWAYNSPTSAHNHVCPLGIQITKRNFPWGPAKHVTNAPMQLVFEAVVQPCSNDPIAGVGSLVYQTSETWDTSGLVSVDYAGTLCACDGSDANDLLVTLRDTVFTPDASDRFTAAGAVLGSGFGPTSFAKTELDQDGHCLQFRIGYGGGSPPQGLSARSLSVDVTVGITQNLVTLDIAATYGYRGKYTGTGSGSLLFGSALGGTTLVFTGGVTGGLLGGATIGTSGASDFASVYKEAWQMAGIDARPFLPPGAGSIFLRDDPTVSVNTEARTITSRSRFYAPWIYDADILLYDMTVDIEMPRPGFGSRRLMHANVGLPPPRPYCNTSGYDVLTVRFTAQIVARTKYFELPLQLTEDALNVWFIGHTVGGQGMRPNQTMPATPSIVKEGYVSSTVTQTWAVRDPSLVPGLKGIKVGNVYRIASVPSLKPVLLDGTIGEAGLA